MVNSSHPKRLSAQEDEFDLIVRNAYLEETENRVDLAISHGRIAAIGSELSGQASQEIDAHGCIASPPFVDPHTHLDKVFLQPSINNSGTLEEAIEIMSAQKGLICGSNFVKRVDRALTMALANGTLAVRTHADVDTTIGTSGLEMMLVRQAEWSGIIDLQIVAFPQDGLISDSNTKSELRKAMQLGADVIGGIPSLESSPSASREHTRIVFDLAEEFNADVDMHIDETNDPSSRTLEMLADATIDAGWQGRVTAAHCCALSTYDDLYAYEVIEKVAEASIHIVTNPTSNLVLQGRHDLGSRQRGITRVKELLAAGINVSCGHDNMRDVFYPFGQADMLEVAFVTSLAAQMTAADELKAVLGMPRDRAAQILGLADYGIRQSGPADIVLIPVDEPIAMLAERPRRKAVIRGGEILFTRSETTQSHVPHLQIT